jgi:osmotically-inducible protein OsmY
MPAHRIRIGIAAAAVAAAVAFAAPAPAATSDAWITTKVKMALLTTDGVSSTAINVDTIDGRVTLHGTVGSASEKQKAEQSAQAINGVREVRNLLAVVAPAAQDAAAVADDKIETSVEAALERDPMLDDSDIEVASVNGGVVVLSGEADTLSDHLRAIEVARAVPGVRRVASQVQGPDALTDAEIWQDTKDTAKQTGSAIGDAARKTGDAVTTAGKQAADSVTTGGAAAADSVSDAWITSAAKMRLIANTTTPGFDINVDTSDGVVTLFGTVPSSEARRAAESEAQAVSGVKRVDNQLTVVAPANQERVAAKDADIKERVVDRLEAHDDVGEDVAVEVSNGTVRLTGTVDSQGERLQALTIARSTSGVRSVVDGLTVDDDRHATR